MCGARAVCVGPPAGAMATEDDFERIVARRAAAREDADDDEKWSDVIDFCDAVQRGGVRCERRHL